MAAGRAAQLARLGIGLRAYLADRVDPTGASRRIRARIELREQRFLELARRLVYEHPRSPYLPLLARAGCEYGDLEAAIRRGGLEGTLEQLRDAGVFVTLAELKGKRPIVRGELAVATRDADFDSPLLLGRGISGTTSGSRSAASRVYYDWQALSEEAENGLLLDAIHGVDEAPLALWFPAPPGVAGLRNVLLTAKCGRPPQRWFSHSTADLGAGRRLTTVALALLRARARLLGLRVPWPEPTPLEEAGRVARWLGSGTNGSAPRTVRTMTSSAVRIAHGALAEGISLDGGTAVIGGEPLDAERRTLIESAGLRVVNRYATAEAGIVAAGCGREPTADAMHLYTDRAAALPSPDGLLLTSLTPFAGKVLLNASLGDHAELSERRCDCRFGELGMSSWISGLGSDERVTIEGMTIRLADLHAIVVRVLAAAGEPPDQSQLWKQPAAEGGSRLAVVVSPRVGTDPQALSAGILEELRRDGELGRLTAEVWSQAGALQVRVAEPKVSRGHKLLPVAGP
jgi:hypothetical protein